MPSALLVGGEAFPAFPGGLNRYLHDLRSALEAVGVDHRAVLIGNDHESREGHASLVSQGALPARLAGMRRAVSRHVQDADVVDTHFALYAAAPLFTRAFGSKPLVSHFHGPWAAESAAIDQPRAAVWVKRMLERAVYRQADRLVVLSYAFKRLLVEDYGIPPWKIEVIRPAVDLSTFTPREDAAAARPGAIERPARPITITVRRLVPRMGLDMLLRAWSRSSLGTLVVVGQGPERSRLTSLAHELGIGDRVVFTGAVSEEQLVDWYRAADICILPSLALEGFGLVVLEALACGTPVLASDAGGLPEALAGLGEDLVIPSADEEALADSIETALTGALALPSATRCRAHAEQFSLQALGERHLRLYSEVVRPRASRRRRVVYLDHCARLSGGELALLKLIAATDVDAHVILGEEGPLVRRLHDAGISVEVLALPESAREVRREQVDLGKLGLLGPLRTALYVPKLAWRLRRLKPDLVHANTLKSGVYGSLAGRLAGIPVLWHLHDRLADDYLPARAARLMHWAVRLLPTALVTNSQASLATVPASPRGGATVVANPVLPTPHREVADQVERVGMVGRLTPWKGQATFLEAFAHAFPDSHERAVIVGAPLFAEEDYADELRSLAQRLGIADRVEFRGFRPNVVAELERLDVFVHASLVPEPFGQVILEAMAAGVPAIAADAGGASEIGEDGRNVLMHQPGDVTALANALRRLANDSGLRQRLAAAGRERAASFAPERIGRQLAATYDALLARLPLPAADSQA